MAAHHVTTYGSASFRVSAGKRKTLSVRLSSAGKQLMSRHRTVKVWANVTLSSGQTRSYTARITLHR
jgi:hypothetical protein